MEKHFEFPFLTREMLNFEQGTEIKLSVKYRTFIPVTFTVRGATRSGLFSHTITTSANQNETESLVALPDIPIWVNVTTPPFIYENGSIYIQLGIALNGNLAYALCSGYVNDSRSISWPNTNLHPPQPDTFGWMELKNVTNPSAGADWTKGLDVYSVSRIRSLQFTLTTSATVANRRVHLEFEDIEGGKFEVWSSVDQAASTTRIYSCCPVAGASSFADDNDILIPIPPNLVMKADSLIRTKTVNLQAGDQFSSISINTEQWFGYAE